MESQALNLSVCNVFSFLFLGLTIKSAEFKRNNVFVNKFVSMRLFFFIMRI